MKSLYCIKEKTFKVLPINRLKILLVLIYFLRLDIYNWIISISHTLCLDTALFKKGCIIGCIIVSKV